MKVAIIDFFQNFLLQKYTIFNDRFALFLSMLYHVMINIYLDAMEIIQFLSESALFSLLMRCALVQWSFSKLC